MTTEAEAVAGLVQKHLDARIQIQKVNDASGRSSEVMFVPAGVTPTSVKKFLDEYATRPERKKGTIVCEDLQSFVEVVKLHRRAVTVLFAVTASKPAITAVFDYHEKAEGQADWCGHRASYPFPITPEWQAWNAISGQWISQSTLAQFLEDHAVDVVEPATAMERARQWADRLRIDFASPARLMSLSQGLAVTVDRRVEEARNLGTGEATLRFEENHQGADGKPLSVPGAVLVEIPVFRGGNAYQLPARLRYRVGKDKAEIHWQISLYRADLAQIDAVREACEMARAGTELPLFYGTPEA